MLLEKARAMRTKAYAPYSGYAVGAALYGKNGRIYGGCNVENASYGLTMCAERAAFFAAVAAGCKEFTALAVATEDGAPPCGACLQVASEFGTKLPVLLAGPRGKARATTLARLFPTPFVPGRKIRKRQSR
jgi:cytidine deaminase